jgi:uncharacterized membrane protein
MAPMMVLVWGGAIALLVLAVRSRTGARRGMDNSVEILRARLASGDITQDEFEKSKRLLQG